MELVTCGSARGCSARRQVLEIPVSAIRGFYCHRMASPGRSDVCGPTGTDCRARRGRDGLGQRHEFSRRHGRWGGLRRGLRRGRHWLLCQLRHHRFRGPSGLAAARNSGSNFWDRKNGLFTSRSTTRSQPFSGNSSIGAFQVSPALLTSRCSRSSRAPISPASRSHPSTEPRSHGIATHSPYCESVRSASAQPLPCVMKRRRGRHPAPALRRSSARCRACLRSRARSCRTPRATRWDPIQV